MFDKKYVGLLSNNTFVPKGWGFENWIWNNADYCGKQLFVKKSKECSWHYHKLKDETFYIQSGELFVFYGFDESINLAYTITLHPGDIFHVPVGLKHRFRGISDVNMFEFSTEHADSDSIRLIPGD